MDDSNEPPPCCALRNLHASCSTAIVRTTFGMATGHASGETSPHFAAALFAGISFRPYLLAPAKVYLARSPSEKKTSISFGTKGQSCYHSKLSESTHTYITHRYTLSHSSLPVEPRPVLETTLNASHLPHPASIYNLSHGNNTSKAAPRRTAKYRSRLHRLCS